MKDRIYDVIIIGAGAAGLSAAEELLKKKKNILILEARPRMGGRAFTFQGRELGPEFIHGKPPAFYKDLPGVQLEKVPDEHRLAYRKKGSRVEVDDPRYWRELKEILAHSPK